MSQPNSSHLLVAAFDFGTTYSGYAFSFLIDPLKVQTNQIWIAGSEQLLTLKTPTSVLLDPDKNFHSFGFQAENTYANLALEEKHHDWMLFRHFKMILHNNENLSRQTTLEDITGKTIDALTVFAMSIKYLKEHLLKALNVQVTGVEETDILYILTVPAIWDDAAKQFMREAAIKAGVDDARLKLALEPEAASIWCQVVTEDAKEDLAGTGSKYMVVDLGGGTADITVHEKLGDGTLRELHKASGGPWGGTYVDNNYLAWLEKLFGKSAIDLCKKENMTDYIDLIREFETKKRTITTTSTDLITFRIYPYLREKANDVGTLEERLKTLDMSDLVSIIKDKLRVHPDVVRAWFEDPVNSVITHVEEILNEPNMEGVNTILLVGGFSESKFIQEAFLNRIKTKRLIVPPEPGLSVLKGAVKFGHGPSTVSSRIMQYTYGMCVNRPFDEFKHPVSKLVIYGGTKYVNGVFYTFVRVGENVPAGHEVKELDFTPPLAGSDLEVQVFRSTDPTPEYTTDPTCKLLGEFTVKCPENTTLEEQQFDVTFVFGETELTVKAKINKTGKEFSTKINCLK